MGRYGTPGGRSEPKWEVCGTKELDSRPRQSPPRRIQPGGLIWIHVIRRLVTYLTESNSMVSVGIYLTIGSIPIGAV